MRRLLLTALVMAMVSWIAAAQTPGGVVVFEGARVLTGDSRPPIEDAALVMANGRITAVGPRSTIKAPAGATVIDVRGKTIMPALVDAHSHLGYIDMRTGNTSAAS